MKILDGLTYTPAWISHMGCLSGCTRYLDIPATDSWIYGATGHAFIINISHDSCPSGPTAWKTQALSAYLTHGHSPTRDHISHPSVSSAREKARRYNAIWNLSHVF